MKWTAYLGTLLLASVGATILGPASARAQSSADIEWLWCSRMQASIMRNYRAVERMRARHQKGIETLRPEHQVVAMRNLDEWYWKKVGDLFQQKRALDAECNWLNIRRDAPGPGREAPVPQPNRPQQPNRGGVWTYPPYQSPRGGGTYDPGRPAQPPSDPFSPNVRR
jgi:hypothetical protein